MGITGLIQKIFRGYKCRLVLAGEEGQTKQEKGTVLGQGEEVAVGGTEALPQIVYVPSVGL